MAMRGWTPFQSRFLRDAGALTASGVIGAGIVVIQGLFLARWLGPRGYGTVALVSAYPAIVAAVLSPDSPQATVRYLAQRDAAADRAGALAVCRVAYLADILVGGVSLLLVAVTATWAEGHVLRVDGTAGLLVLMAVALLLASPAHAATATLVHARRYRVIAVEQVLNAAVRSALMVAAVGMGQGPAGAVRGAAAGYVLHGISMSILGVAEERRRWHGTWLRADTAELGRARREMLRFLAWTDLGAFLATLTKQVDVLFLGWFVGPAEAGYYRLARSVAALPGYVVGPLQSAAYPRLAKSWSTGGDLRTELCHHVRLGIGLATAGLVGVLLFPVVIPLVAGAGFQPAIGIAQVLLLGSLAWIAGYWLRPMFMAAGEARAWVTISAVVVAVSLVLFAPAAVLFGGIGVALVQAMVGGVGGHALAFLRARRFGPSLAVLEVRHAG